MKTLILSCLCLLSISQSFADSFESTYRRYTIEAAQDLSQPGSFRMPTIGKENDANELSSNARFVEGTLKSIVETHITPKANELWSERTDLVSTAFSRISARSGDLYIEEDAITFRYTENFVTEKESKKFINYLRNKIISDYGYQFVIGTMIPQIEHVSETKGVTVVDIDIYDTGSEIVGNKYLLILFPDTSRPRNYYGILIEIEYVHS